MSRPRVVLLRGHGVTPWELRPWELLAGRYDIRVLVSSRNRFDLEDLGLAAERVRTTRGLLPGGRAGNLGTLAVGDRYLGLERHLRAADVVHALELGVPWSGQPAALRDALGFKLVLTVWETIPLLETYRYPRGRGYRRAALEHADLFLATTPKARDALVLEGVVPERIEISPPGIDVARFSPGRGGDTVVSVGRLVWEKGHQDVLRALAALRRGVVPGAPPRLRIVGRGPDGDRLRRHAAELGVDDLVELSEASYAEMPGVFAQARALVLASLPLPVWEEQFGMVIAEAFAAGVPVVASDSGAIPEVVRDAGAIFPAGDWRALARLLAGELPVPSPELAREYSIEAAADRLDRAYRRVLG
ncbi:MAG TPA: glycosyltransferase [Gaiellaceae bacterium]|jgi:glycosyltransferase involved in cell wall biosynthesis|nr:glycosyltransferase [Gaiellaceae bacterium]